MIYIFLIFLLVLILVLYLYICKINNTLKEKIFDIIDKENIISNNIDIFTKELNKFSSVISSIKNEYLTDVSILKDEITDKHNDFYNYIIKFDDYIKTNTVNKIEFDDTITNLINDISKINNINSSNLLDNIPILLNNITDCSNKIAKIKSNLKKVKLDMLYLKTDLNSYKLDSLNLHKLDVSIYNIENNINILNYKISVLDNLLNHSEENNIDKLEDNIINPNEIVIEQTKPNIDKQVKEIAKVTKKNLMTFDDGVKLNFISKK